MRSLFHSTVQKGQGLLDDLFLPDTQYNDHSYHLLVRLLGVVCFGIAAVIGLSMTIYLLHFSPPVSLGDVCSFFILNWIGWQLWQRKTAGWIGVKVVLVFCIFVQLLSAYVQLDYMQDLWSFRSYGIFFSSIFLKSIPTFFTIPIAAFLFFSLNEKQILAVCGVSALSRKIVDFFIAIFVVCILVIFTLG